MPNYFSYNARIREPARGMCEWVGEEVQLSLNESFHDGYMCTGNS